MTCGSSADPGKIGNTKTGEWASMSVAGEIIRGYKLHEEKPKYKSRDYPMIVNLKKSHYLYKQPISFRKSRRASRNTSPCWCDHSLFVPNSKPQRKSRKYKKKNKTRCPLRIAELAVPTKRHCIDTWRNKSFILPDFMVYRLKQHVMDQRPIAHISDAIRCFRMRKRFRKKSTKSSSNKLDHQIPRMRKVDVQNLCLLFAMKIVPKLVTPLNITMNSDFEKLFRVVSREITTLTKFKKCLDSRCGNSYRQIKADVTNKITLWIMNIMDDANYKFLEENIKDLEREVGPPVDFLEDVVDTVLDICLPRPSIESSEVESDSYIPRSEDEYECKEECYSDESRGMIAEIDAENEVKRPQSMEEIDIENILKPPPSIDEIDSENVVELPKSTEEINAEMVIESPQHLSDELKEYTDKEFFENEILDIINQLSTDSEYFENAINNIIDNICQSESRDESQDVTDAQDINKDDVENVEAQTTPTLIDSDIANAPTVTVENEEQLTKSSSETRHNIVFAEPNEHVLSDADESWPSDTFSPRTLKPSASITKSIISLGKLSEDDEKTLSSTDIENTKSETESQNKEVDILMPPDTTENEKKHVKRDGIVIESNITSTEKLSTEMQDGNITDNIADGELPNEEINGSDKLPAKYTNADEKFTDTVSSPVHKLPSNDQIPVEVDITVVEDSETVKTDLQDSKPRLSKNVSDENLTDPVVELSEGETLSKNVIDEKLTDPVIELSEGEPKLLVKDLGSKDKLLSSTEAKVVKSRDLLDAVSPDAKSVVKLTKSAEVNPIPYELAELQDKEIAEFIIEFIKILKSGDKPSVSKKDNVITVKLVKLQDLDLSDEELTKAIASIVRKYLSELKTISTETCDTKSQTDARKPSQLKTAKIPSININSKSKIDKDLDKNKRIAPIPQHKSSLPMIKKKAKTKNKGIATEEPETDKDNTIKDQSATAAELDVIKTKTQENVVALSENEIRSWCKDLDNGFKNLEIWKDWLQNACIETVTLIKKKRMDCLYSKEKHVRNWMKLNRDIRQDVALWKTMNQHTHEIFEDFRKYYSDDEMKLSKFKSSCSCVSKGRKTRRN